MSFRCFLSSDVGMMDRLDFCYKIGGDTYVGYGTHFSVDSMGRSPKFSIWSYSLVFPKVYWEFNCMFSESRSLVVLGLVLALF
jgi:hypothetical protein